MHHRRVMQSAGTRSIVLLLLFSIVLLGMTVTRQQSLGPLHLHKDLRSQGVSTFSAATSKLASDWLDRWRQQQRFGHSALRTRIAPDAHLLPLGLTEGNGPMLVHAASAHDHDHDALERHHHRAGDGSVLALDGAAEAAELADGAAGGASSVLPIVAIPSDGLPLPAIERRGGAWPAATSTAFVSWYVTPPLRPPAR